jgi:hypothetical protein
MRPRPESTDTVRAAGLPCRPHIHRTATFLPAIHNFRFTQIALKNPQNAPAPNSSIWAATLGISADCALQTRRTVTGGRLSANAGKRVSVASTIVIESKIRVFQHNPQIAVIHRRLSEWVKSRERRPAVGSERSPPIGRGECPLRWRKTAAGDRSKWVISGPRRRA